ncbi:MAG: hypothetical protein ACFFCZ_09340 [Promethearchaeota archaeon]
MISVFLSERPTEKTTKYLIISSFLLLVISMPIVIGLLTLSNSTGDVYAFQLGFNAEYIRSVFSLMSNEELSIFILGNLFDYVFMIAYGTLIFSSALLLTRKLREGSIWNQIGFFIAIAGIIASCCDAMENIFLLLMVSNPVNFPSWLAIPHSSFALVKFIILYASMGWIFLTIVLIVLSGLIKRNQIKS